MALRKLLARRYNVASHKTRLYSLQLVFFHCERLCLPYSRIYWKPTADSSLAFNGLEFTSLHSLFTFITIIFRYSDFKHTLTRQTNGYFG